MNPSSALRKIREKHRNGLLLHWAFERLTSGLSRLGVTVQVTVIYREGMVEVDEPQMRLSDCTWGIATPADLAEMIADQAFSNSREEFSERAQRGARCYLVRHNGGVVAYIWCEINGPPRPRFGLTFGPRDAYVFDAHAVSSHRGMNILPFLKYQVLQDLKRQGCTNVWTSTDAFNRTAQRYKRKLAACPSAIRLYIGLFGRFEKVFTLYRFHHASDLPNSCNS